MRPATITIPQPCAESWAAMSPTATGRHCAACQTEVVDFTCMNEAEVLAYFAARPKQRVCGFVVAPVASPRHYKRKSGLRRWLLTAAAFFGGHHVSALNLPPQRPPVRITSFFWAEADQATITIRGVVLDDSLDVPVQSAYVFINDTKYGAVTNERGEFVMTFTAGWSPVKSGFVNLKIARIAFTFLEQKVEVDLHSEPAPVRIRLRSVPQRGYIMGKAVFIKPPVPPPGSRKTRR